MNYKGQTAPCQQGGEPPQETYNIFIAGKRLLGLMSPAS